MKKTLFVIITAALILGGCQKKVEETNDVPAQAAKSEKVEIIDPWIRPSASGTNTALFFKVFNNTGKPDTLYDAASEMAIKTEVHETYLMEGDMMGMRHVEQVVIPAGDTVIFKPRDLHVMLMKLKNDVLVGDSGIVSLMFRTSGEVKVTGLVRGMN